jgi:hypothetical protein
LKAYLRVSDQFVSDILKEMAARKVKFYGKKVRSYKAKYGSFAEFTRKLRGKASPKEEDQWMDWDAAVNMLNSWEHVTSELDSRAS